MTFEKEQDDKEDGDEDLNMEDNAEPPKVCPGYLYFTVVGFLMDQTTLFSAKEGRGGPWGARSGRRRRTRRGRSISRCCFVKTETERGALANAVR